MPPPLRGKVALVVGAASVVGRATSLLLARSGAAVFCADASAPAALRTARLVDAESAPFGHTRVDPARLPDLRRMFAECRRALGPADALVNCVEVASPRLWTEGFSEADFDLVLHANLRSVVFATHLAVREMGDHGGAVVNLASYEAVRGMAHDPVLAASKAGVEAFTRSLAYLQAQCGVRVMCVSPTVLDGPAPDVAGPERRRSVDVSPRLQPSAVADAICQLVARGRGGMVKELRAQA